MTYEFLKTLYSDIMSMIKGMTIKRMDLAKANETTATARNFELYLACLNGRRTFHSFRRFDKDILEAYCPPSEVYEYFLHPHKIPVVYHEDLIREESKRVIETYVEYNEYYRMLMGLPRTDDKRWIYVKNYEDIPEDVPIHQMSNPELSNLEIRGELDKIRKAHPDADYLNYLGPKSIDLIQARLAKPFEILALGPCSNPRSEEMFRREYYGAREYIMATIYNRDIVTSKTLYDPIIGILMVCLAVRNTLTVTEFDYLNFEEILDAILESYGILTYFKEFPYTYKRRLVLALDRLLAHKGTDGVLVDVCKLFSDNDLVANRYYVLKTQPKGNDGNVLFTGDVKQDYKLQFAKASIEEHDINTQEEHLVSYESVTENDYLWQMTEEETDALREMDFNLMMSKYIDTQVGYEISGLVFEVCCFINLLLYARENEERLRIINVYATGGECSLFTMIVFLLAGMAKRGNLDGNIVYEPAAMAEIWGFNYKDIEEELKAIVDKYELLIDVDDSLVEGFDVELAAPYGHVNQQDLLNVYAENKALYDAIFDEMCRTNDIRKYIALSNARDLMYTYTMERKTFERSNGQPASTYYEMLLDLDPKLAQKLDGLEDEWEINNLIIYVLERLEEMFDSPILKYLFLNTPTVYISLLSRYIKIAIKFFKASSVQMRSMNILFYLGDMDPIHVIDQREFHKWMFPDEWVHVEDTVSTHKTIHFDEYVAVGDKIVTNTDAGGARLE